MSKRESGYYWVRAKDFDVWFIAEWFVDLDDVAKWWNLLRSNEITDHIVEIDERRIVRGNETIVANIKIEGQAEVIDAIKEVQVAADDLQLKLDNISKSGLKIVID